VSDINKFANIKRFGTSYKLTLLKCLPVTPTGEVKIPVTSLPNDCKLKCNISRARARIFELAMCNSWEWFITCTLDPAKYARDDLETFRKDLAQFIRNQSKKWKCDLDYLFIPELHFDGINWHMHGLISGLTAGMVSDFIRGVHPDKLVDGGYKNWSDYANKFGFVSLGEIRSLEQVAKYTMKYISKDVAKSVQEVGSRMFYNSQGLAGAELVKKGTIAVAPSQWDYENDYVKIIWIQEQEINKYILD
jgi:hypothetical protein